MYQNYIFDLYGTLIDIHTDEGCVILWKKLCSFYCFHGAPYSPLELKNSYRSLADKALKKPSLYEHKEIQIEYVFEELYMNKGIHPSSELLIHTCELFRILSTDYLRLYSGAKELLLKLKNAGKNVYLLSNAQRVFTEPEMKSLGIYDCFDGILFSSDAFCQKPDQAFFKHLFDLYGLNKKESIMIGNDAGTDITGAFLFGLDTMYLHSNQSNALPDEILPTFLINPIDLEKAADLLL